MTLESLTDLDVAFGWDGSQSDIADLKSVISEVRGINLSVCSGEATAGETMTVSGIATTDTILSAWEVRHDAAANPVNRTASTTITASGTIKCNEALDVNSQFFVLWMDKTGR